MLSFLSPSNAFGALLDIRIVGIGLLKTEIHTVVLRNFREKNRKNLAEKQQLQVE